MRTWGCGVGVILLLLLESAQAEVAQHPLVLSGKVVPGNMAIVGSLEFPTMVSKANNGAPTQGEIDTSYSSSTVYVGYFDPTKCYDYIYSSTETNRYFKPVNTDGPVCSGRWSGNYLNWATTQAIDTFRKTLTGGYRVVDTTTTTWLEKGNQDGQGARRNFPEGQLSNTNLIAGVTPYASLNYLRTRILGLGNKMYISTASPTSLPNILGTTADPASIQTTQATLTTFTNQSSLSANRIYELSVRVKVCDTTVGVEDNCVRYSDSNWKPEGLLQKHALDMRFSGFGYLGDGRRYNDSADASTSRDGGVMRARMKFVGPYNIDPTNGKVANTNNEWDATTGVFINNPDPADASSTQSRTGQTVSYSGVVNYINRTGQIVSDALYKRYDPSAELYYSAIRYFTGAGNDTNFSAVTGSTTKQRQLVDGLPVITDWYPSGRENDPYQYSCQKNFVLGIGDTNTSYDENVPSDITATYTPSVFRMEGASQSSFTGTRKPYLAGLAYKAHIKDMRSNYTGDQRLSTYWIDILEFGDLKRSYNNQYWLAAKYGGFSVPDGYNDGDLSSLPDNLWHNTADVLSSGDKRPDNFYVVSKADEMAQSLSKAFADITAEIRKSASSLASDTLATQLYQVQYDSTAWSGDVQAYAYNTSDVLEKTWSASSALNNKVASGIANRVMVTWDAGNHTGIAFTKNTLTATQQSQLQTTDATSGVTPTVEQAVNFIRGDHSLEKSDSAPGNPFRMRLDRNGKKFVLGDIIHSSAVYVGVPDFFYSDAMGDSKHPYTNFKRYHAERKPMVYAASNDGAVHGFDATTGEERLAYIPNAVYYQLNKMLFPSYNTVPDHLYSVDATPSSADAYFSNSWHTVLTGGLGAGGKAIYALDISLPGDTQGSKNQFSEGNASNLVLWEFDEAADLSLLPTGVAARLGYTFSKPAVVRLNNGKWAVIFGNGYDSAAGLAVLYVVYLDAMSDASWKASDIVRVYADSSQSDSTTAIPTTKNGLSGIAPVDKDGDGTIDLVYAGDLQGNLWRFDLSASNSSSWSSTKVFVATSPTGAAQPITVQPEVGRAKLVTGESERGFMLYFGTGKYYEKDDVRDTSTQSFYVVKDVIDSTTHPGVLTPTNLGQITASFSASGRYRIVTTQSTSAYGWRMDLSVSGERVVNTPELRRGNIIFTTLVPSATECEVKESGWLFVLHAASGRSNNAIDTNGDGVIDTKDSDNGDNVAATNLASPAGVLLLDKGDKLAAMSENDGIPVATSIAKGATYRQNRVNWQEVFPPASARSSDASGTTTTESSQ